MSCWAAHWRRSRRAALTSAAVVLVMFGLGAWSFGTMRESPRGGTYHLGGHPRPGPLPDAVRAEPGPAPRPGVP
ncbi:MAG TPA: hypothetical protein VII59_21255 [Streptosporangiaceae bacterium]